MSKSVETLSLILLLCFAYCFLVFSIKADSKYIRGAVIPHHLLAKELIEDLAVRLQKQNPGRIFIIGPNHYEIGKNKIITDNPEFLNQTNRSQFISLDIDTISSEHSCSTPVSILKPFLFQSQFICLILSSNLKNSEISQLSAILSSNLQPSDILIVSSDFSHYLDLFSANQNDEITQGYIEKNNTDSLFKLDNRYLDSPASLVTLLTALSVSGPPHPQIINHLNSAQILNQPNLPSTTSYFEIIYY